MVSLQIRLCWLRHCLSVASHGLHCSTALVPIRLECILAYRNLVWSDHTYDLLTSSLFSNSAEITSYTGHSPPDEAIAPGFVTTSFVLTWIIDKPATPPSHMDNRQEKAKLCCLSWW